MYTLTILPQRLAVAKLPANAPLPDWFAGEFFSITRTADELSFVVEEARIPDGITAELGWRALKVEGPLELSLVGVLASLSGALAAAGVPLLALSTFDTDYLLVHEENLLVATTALQAAGYTL